MLFFCVDPESASGARMPLPCIFGPHERPCEACQQCWEHDVMTRKGGITIMDGDMRSRPTVGVGRARACVENKLRHDTDIWK